MDEEKLKQKAEKRTEEYMLTHTDKGNCECTKLETANWNAGLEYGYEQGYIAGAIEETKELVEENKTAKKIIKGLLIILRETANDEYDFEKACPFQYEEAEQFVKE